MKIIFMGTPEFAAVSLQALLDEGIRPLLVVSQPDKKRGRGQTVQPTPVKALAEQAGLPVATPENVNAPEFLRQIRRLNPDLIIVVAFGQILKKELLAIAPQGIVNVHASLLPRYRGAAPIARAVMNGEQESGVTTMFINEGMDTGDMIFKASVQIGPNMTGGQLHDALAKFGGKLLVRTVEAIAAGNCPRTPQDHQQASYAARLSKNDELLDWTKDAQTLHDQIRGLAPAPGAYTLLRGKRLKCLASEIVDLEQTGAAGEIVGLEKGLTVTTGRGLLRVVTVQPEGKKALSADDFCRGHQISVGTFLGE